MRKAIPGVVAALVAIAAIVGVFYAWHGTRTELRIATAGRGGTYFPLGESIAEILNRELPDQVHATAIETAGSLDNIDRLDAGTCELAIVQNDAPAAPSMRSIAPLYDEVMHAVVRADLGITRVEDLAGHHVSVGPLGSGTAILGERLFEHFEVPVVLEHLTTMEGVEAFGNGRIDGLLIVSGLRSEAVATLLERGDAELLSFGAVDGAGSALEGLRYTHPFVDRAVIPARTYGAHPTGPVGTIGVTAVLVSRADLDSSLVHDITQALFENRVALTSRHGAMIRLSERFDPADLQASLHDGADTYLRRDEPPFYVEYAEVISLGITILLTLGSGLLAVRQWVERRMKNRIDTFYVEIREISSAVDRGERTAESGRAALLSLSSRAFQELVDERLEANQSFTIFQDYLTFEIRRMERAAPHLARIVDSVPPPAAAAPKDDAPAA